MPSRKKVFVSQKISLLLDNQEIRIQALVSTYGAKYVCEEDELPVKARELLGSEVNVLYKTIQVRCRVVRETTPGGLLISLRFENPSPMLIRQIEMDVRENGLPSPWPRAFPRLNTNVKHLPVPALALVEHYGSTLFLNVKNFTLGGLMLEHQGVPLDDMAIGTRLNFDLVTNAGEKISDFSAIVSNSSTEYVAAGMVRMQFGVRFLPMNVLTESKYRDLIRSHCLGLRESPAAEA